MHTHINQPEWSEAFARCAAMQTGLFLGRVESVSRSIYRVGTKDAALLAQVSGKFRRAAVSPADFPAVGDYVMLDKPDDQDGNALIHHVLPRKSVFLRTASGGTCREQVIAANIDTVFLCMALDRDFKYPAS